MAYISRYLIFVGSNVKRCLLPLVFQKHVTVVVLIVLHGDCVSSPRPVKNLFGSFFQTSRSKYILPIA